jgi:hypothetical protein
MTQARTRINQPGDVHVDVALSNLSIAFGQSADRFVATQVFPDVPVDKQTDQFYEWLRDFWFRNVMGEKTPASYAPRHNIGLKTQQFNALGYWLEAVLDNDVVANEDAAVNQEMAKTQWLTQQALLNREIKFAAAAFATSGLWGTHTALSTTDQWDDADESNPITNAKTAIQTIEKNTGSPPNTLVVGAEVWDNGLVDHPLILDKYKHTQRGILTQELVAPALGIDRILVARAIENTAIEKAEGTESYTGAYIVGKFALFLNVVPGVGLLQPAAGKTFNWRPNGLGMQIERYPDERADAEILRIRDYFDQKITSTQHGYSYHTVVS